MERVSELFDKVVDLAPGERAALLQTIDDLELRAEVERLLEAHDRVGREPDFMEKPVVEWTSSTDSTSLPVFFPDQIVADRYRIMRFLGEGGMGQVFQAKDEVLGRFVALKTIRPEIASDPRILERFKTEVKLAQEVADENVCRVFDLDHRNLPPFLTMEYLDGQTLASRLRSVKKKMTTAEALPLVEQMGRGLHAAHVKGVVHGDFKPGNVMLVRTGSGATRAKVTDFGLARTEDPDGSLSSTHPRGTPSYMAPEQLLGAKAAVTSDIYALGLVTYEMVTGARPEFNRLMEPAPSPRELAPGLDKNWDVAILRCLERDPAERFRSAADLLRSLEVKGTGHIRVPRPSRRTVLEAGVSLVSLSLLGDTVRVLRGKATIREGSSVLLNDVENLTQDPELDAVSEVLRSQLGQSAHFNVMDRPRVSEILRRMVRDPSKKLDPPTAREVALREGAPLVVFGALSRLAQDYTLNLKIEKVSNRPDYPAASWRQTWNAANKSELFNAIHQGSSWIRLKAGEAADDLANADLKPEESTTPSWEALRLYSEAEKLKAKDKAEEAIVLLTEAVEKDPEFALAYMRLGDLSLSLYRDRDGFAYWRKALDTVKARRLTLREELRIKGLFASDTGDLDEAEKAFRRFAAHYPNDYLPHFYLGRCLVRQGRTEEGIEWFLQAQRLKPAAYYMPGHLARSYVMLGQLDRVPPYVDRLRQLEQEDAALFYEGAISFLKSDFARSLDRFVRMSGSDRNEWHSRGYALQACLLSELGKYQAAVHALQEGLSFDLRKGNPPLRADKLIALAYIYYRVNDRNPCKQACLDAMQLEQGPDRSRQAGTLLARAGFTAEAQNVLRGLGEVRDQPRAQIAALRISGEILLARGKHVAAIEQLKQAHQVEPSPTLREYLARALAISGDLMGALSLYKEIVDFPEHIWHQPDAEFPGLLTDSLSNYSYLVQSLGKPEAGELFKKYQIIRREADVAPRASLIF